MQSIRFTCEGTIVGISTTREWYYNTCTLCNKKLKGDISALECRDHGPQPKPNYRYSFKAFVADDSTTAHFTFFSPGADDIVQIECRSLVKSLENPDPYDLPDAIQAIKGKKHILQFHFNPLSRKESPEFILDTVLDNLIPTITTLKPISSTSALTIKATNTSTEKDQPPFKAFSIQEALHDDSGVDRIKDNDVATPTPDSPQIESSGTQPPELPTSSAKRMLFHKPEADENVRTTQTKKKKSASGIPSEGKRK